MTNNIDRMHLLRLVLLTFILCTSTVAIGQDQQIQHLRAFNESSVERNSGAATSEMLAGLSDEQLREMLMAQVQNNENAAMESPRKMKGPGHFFHRSLNFFTDEHEKAKTHLAELAAGVPAVTNDLFGVFLSLCPYGTPHGALQSTIWILLYLAVGVLFEILFKRFFFTKYLPPAMSNNVAQIKASQKLTAVLVQLLPRIIGLFIFFSSAYFAFMIFTGTGSETVQLFFLATLLSITFVRAILLISHIVFSPSIINFRIIPIDCKAANIIHTAFVVTASYIILTLMTAVVVQKLGASMSTVRLIQLFGATSLLAVSGFFVLIFRKPVRDIILSSDTSACPTATWTRQQFAGAWHILALLYLTTLWFLLIKDMADPSHKASGAFIPSFFIFPIWLAADALIQWIVLYGTKALQIYQAEYDDKVPPSPEELEQREKGKALYLKIKAIARVGIALSITIWLAALWDIRIPLLSKIAGATFDAMVIIALAIFCWQIISAWIERKIQESIPEEEENQEDDEWGGAASRGRAYTLLPMVRKFVGTILVVMVTMTVLSSIGVDIGPLLAGAGVIGLAIGFGAQKLVADVFSGFFYLLDDAFRVGEYIEAGDVSGSVEAITLRNAMLRHHRGMLQIIPHSDLGTITNYMRGGIIVKFNLDFPYDAPIDKIRKIIKKVGQRMLDNEDYGKDFIRPVKSQGVREITNSVMTIRVKFTAQPGTHFVIRREAYRLITEALNAQNIYYAHKKVIVDLPEPVKNDEGVSKAAGAAASRAIEESEPVQQQNENGILD